MQSPKTHVTSQFLKAKSVVCSVFVKETWEVSKAETASKEESKNKVAMHKECPFLSEGAS